MFSQQAQAILAGLPTRWLFIIIIRRCLQMPINQPKQQNKVPQYHH